jgi:hypothetical protein
VSMQQAIDAAAHRSGAVSIALGKPDGGAKGNPGPSGAASLPIVSGGGTVLWISLFHERYCFAT